MDIARVDPTNAALILIDAQPAFIDTMAVPQEPVLARLEHLLLLADHFEIPCLATFEHPVEKKGWLPERLERAFPNDGQRHVKHTYSLMAEREISTAVQQLRRSQLIVTGAETDVCVLQSVLGMLEIGYQVFLVEDCLFTAEPNDGPALRRMYAAGAVPLTYKMLYFELKRTVDEPAYHTCWNAQLTADEPRYVDPYDLPDVGSGDHGQ
jgi:nicotinamidase-related amidase